MTTIDNPLNAQQRVNSKEIEYKIHFSTKDGTIKSFHDEKEVREFRDENPGVLVRQMNTTIEEK